jgi:hypothetical protein
LIGGHQQEAPMSDPLPQVLSDHHKIEPEGQLYRCPCGEKFSAAEHAVCPSCGASIPERETAISGEPLPTCTDNSAPAAPRGGGSAGVSAGHRLHLEEAMAVRETETRIRSGVYAAANPETVRDRASFLAFVAALGRDAHRMPAANRTVEMFLGSAASWAAEPGNQALSEAASWREFARFLLAGASQEKGQ